MTDKRYANLWWIHTDGSDQRPLTTGQYNDPSPRWSNGAQTAPRAASGARFLLAGAPSARHIPCPAGNDQTTVYETILGRFRPSHPHPRRRGLRSSGKFGQDAGRLLDRFRGWRLDPD